MGGSASRPDVAGFRVLRVEPASPAAAAGHPWVPYLDVLVAAGDTPLDEDGSALTAALKAHVGQALDLHVVNAKSGREHTVTVSVKLALVSRRWLC